MLVCDHDKGLLRLDPSNGRITVVLDGIDGAALRFRSNVARSEDGSIYVTTSSDTATWDDYEADAIAHANSGRLIRIHSNGGVTAAISLWRTGLRSRLTSPVCLSPKRLATGSAGIG